MTPLLDKLHYKASEPCVVINLPHELREEFETAINFITYSEASSAITTFVLLFVKDVASLNHWFPSVVKNLEGDVTLWIAYPKKSSKKYKTDISRDHGWEILGKHGFEPVSQIAFNTDISILRFRHIKFIKTMIRPLSARITQDK